MPKALLGVVVAVLALGGCGGGDHKKNVSGVQKTKDTVTVGHNQPIAFGAKEYSFEPRNVTVNAGTSAPTVVRFALRNNGTQAHDLHVVRNGTDLGGTPIFAPGKVAAGQARLGPGTYQFICTVDDHAALGMKGTLTVTSNKTVRPKEPDQK